MNDFSQPYSPVSPVDAAYHSPPRRSVDASGARMNGHRNGAMPMPMQRPFHRMSADGSMLPGGLPARSPPKPNKNTQHVPCKFFLQGQCQAGQACPFSHDVESSVRPAPCKYFAKGGCKFGRKCALLHITPDGTVVNRMPTFSNAPSYHAAAAAAGSPHPAAFAQAPPPGLLAQGLEQRPNGELPPEYEGYQYDEPRNGYEMPNIDMTYTTATSKYGSPNHNEYFPHSPPHNALSVLDAPLPGSFDSNDISWAARHGPLAASVPSKFGIESPPSSLPRRPQLAGTAVRDLRTSAFGERGMDNVLASMGSSPPSGPDEPMRFEKRSLMSHPRAARPIVSASLGTRLPTQSFEYSDDEDGHDTDREEDLLPSSLHDLIPEGRARKNSRSRPSDDSPASFLAAQRRTISTPQESKIGSPSRYTSMFARASSSSNGFGHVGSPLRDSSFFASSATSRMGSNGELSPSISSPPRQASMSMLTQELQRTKLDAARSAAAGQHAPMPIRTLSNGSTGGHTTRRSLDRGLSTNSVGQRIDEDPELFDMDGLGDSAAPRVLTNGSSPKEEPASFGPIGGQRMAK